MQYILYIELTNIYTDRIYCEKNVIIYFLDIHVNYHLYRYTRSSYPHS